MQARASIPCHHPKWPMQCPHCNCRAEGFSITVPLSQKWDPEAKEMRRWAWGASGMACMQCNIAIIPNEFHKDVSEGYVRALVDADIPGLGQVQVVPTPWFDEHCCLPAEEPAKVN